MNTGLIGGIVGSVIGLAGGIIGTYFSIKNTNGPRERAFMIRASVICLVAILLFLALLFALPNPYKWFMWIPYGILLPLGIVYWNRKQQRIRQDESQNHRLQPTPLRGAAEP
jgi:Ca2+/Na+ antiporter